MEIVEGPQFVKRAKRQTLGIRALVPYRGMLAERDRLERELLGWVKASKTPDAGPIFMRLHLVDMKGVMEIEVGLVVPDPLMGDERVRPGVIPAGEYATLTYRGEDVRSNGHLITWVAEQGREFDRDRTPAGDAFASRCEIWATDPRTEPRKKQRFVQLDFLVRSGPATGSL
jgi:hypothetical protein